MKFEGHVEFREDAQITLVYPLATRELIARNVLAEVAIAARLPTAERRAEAFEYLFASVPYKHLREAYREAAIQLLIECGVKE